MEEESGRIVDEIEVLGELKRVRDEAQRRILAFADLDRITLAPETLQLIPARVLLEFRILPLKKDGSNLFLGMADPDDRDAQEYVAAMTGCRVIPVVVWSVQIDAFLGKLAV